MIDALFYGIDCNCTQKALQWSKYHIFMNDETWGDFSPLTNRIIKIY